MAVKSKIGWTDNTFSAWRGCLKTSPACKFCYADAFSGRNPKTLGVFGTEAQGGTRVVAADDYWQQPLKWNREAAEPDIPVCAQCGAAASHGLPRCPECDMGIDRSRPRVFCASLSDVFEDWPGAMMNNKGEQLYRHVSGKCGWRPASTSLPSGNKVCGACGGWCDPVTMDDVRQRLFELIDSTPNLDWQLLTKRPENIRRMWTTAYPPHSQDWVRTNAERRHRRNTWLGTTVENQEYADKRIPDLLKCSDLAPVLFLSMEALLGPVDLSSHLPIEKGRNDDWRYRSKFGEDVSIAWVIVGCESGPNRRETKLEWVRELRDQCKAVDIPFFVKQLEVNGKVTTDANQFPEDLRIQEFPDGQ